MSEILFEIFIIILIKILYNKKFPPRLRGRVPPLFNIELLEEHTAWQRECEFIKGLIVDVDYLA